MSFQEVWEKEPMKKPRIQKVTVNFGVGEAGDRLTIGAKVIEELTGQSPVRTLAKQTNPAFGIRKKLPIGLKVTLRGKKAEEFLKNAFTAFRACGKTLFASSFDQVGNFSFGVPEHIDFPGQKYDPSVGIYGMDICVTFEKSGYRVKSRKVKRSHIPEKHLVTKDEAIEYIQAKFDTEVVRE
ncbi:large subunit ribosomal protein L5 [Methanococcus maripaludis]|uniref:Large ribosomal subunit protein uL5 n=1 Tax=Methanococcus maripaludis TaxID=39152 RepID=A0A7J9P8K8_METMI|nr:50S ribosomal protein L5 [Methanococcus maripaludis]MBA2839805.1 large subunit ribosomal protein L5 [Methanococcus maripaludis]MBA2852382.1 large subunit ribosomal protein L5 [Methanococcus maripaludis]MBA2859523.1 large subunit ribosomal protein L5 [Methanococcus maripaludis]MBA2868160.1 large subunit ribosomal protein L5 [Methanococcus maripaludis]MBB6401268.1 large subunit ribosomal protein L5 [Methanococcus maripaludis]